MRTPLLTLAAIGLGAALTGTSDAQTTWLVSNDPLESPDFPGLHEALESPLVVDGDTVLVSEGIGMYTPPNSKVYDFHLKAITVRAQPGERPILHTSPLGSPYCCPDIVMRFNGERRDTVLDGFEFRGGVQWSIVVDSGSPTIRNCHFEGLGLRNGVIYVGQTGHPLFQGCTFHDNQIVFLSVIVANADITLEDCTFSECWAYEGLLNLTNATLRRCEFRGNSSGVNTGDLDGYDLVVENCRFISTTRPGSGIGAWRAPHVRAAGTASIVNTLFVGANDSTSPLIRFDNTADRSVTNCTFVNNTAASLVWAYGSVPTTLRNAIAWSNTLSQPTLGGLVNATYSNIQGGYPGLGNISAAPIFRNTAAGDYRLAGGSPGIDRGDASALPPGLTLDLAGKPRFVEDPNTPNLGIGPFPHPDMGAYEYQGVCKPDFTATAVPGAPGFGVPDGNLSTDDFFYYLIQFSNRHPLTDLTTTAVPGSPGYATPNGIVNNDDFFYYTTLYAAGC